MSLPTFDATKHHVGLGTASNALKGFMLEGGFVKDVQREVSGGAPELGGNTDLIGQQPSLSRWTQDDFVGGMYAYNWGRDDAMFADCTGMMPAQQSRSLLSCPPMVEVDNGLGSSARTMFMVGGYIYVVSGNTITRTLIGSWSTTSFNVGGNTISFAEYDSIDQKIWCGVRAPGSTNYILRLNTDLSLPSVDFIMQGPPNTTGWSMPNGTIFSQHVVIQSGRRLFIGDPPKNHEASTPGKIKWRDVTRLPGKWKDSLAWSNTLYILINDGSFKSQIYAFDGTDATPICVFPFSFYAKCMVEYAGRIFVGGTGFDVNGGEFYAELYEVTGASTRLVRTFDPETRNVLKASNNEWPTAIDDLTVHDGLLWMCEKGKRMIAYDVTSDGFFGAAEIQGSSSRQYAKLISGRGRLWALTTDGKLDRIRQTADGASGTAWNPTFVTSDFTYEIAMTKTWSEMVVLTRYGKVTSIEYSTNSGGSWTSLATPTYSSDGQVHFNTVSLSGITPSKIIRFRIKLSSTGDAGIAETYHRELVAWTVSFSMTNTTKKKAWNLTVNGSGEIETRDAEFDEGVTQTYTPEEIRDQLWTWHDASTTLVLKDPSGDEYNVKIDSMREVMPLVGPNVSDEPEAQFPLVLLEV